MDRIYIPQLETASQQTELLQVNECLTGLESLTPVKGKLQVVHHGTYLQVDAQVETIVTLGCDRCLQQYNHRLVADASEVLWFEDEGPELGVDITLDGPVETLSSQGYFEPNDWLYQQLCLEWPQRQICGPACTGMDPSLMTIGSDKGDLRWSALAALKQTLSQD
ncbi:MAG: DUF177 domain-containing protein [Thermosynechococcaceae cyanobacterium]